MEEADRLAQRLAVVDQGRIVAEGTAATLRHRVAGEVVTLVFDATEAVVRGVAAAFRARPGVRRVLEVPEGLALHMDAAGADAPGLRAGAEALGAKVTAVRVGEPTLDDLFVVSTGRGLRATEVLA